MSAVTSAVRAALAIALAPALAIAPSFACASREELPADPPPPPVPDQPLDASAPDAPVEDVLPKARTCSEEGFCYVPTLMPLAAVTASSEDDAWMIPQTGGTILRWNGTSIDPVYDYEAPTPPSIGFVGLWSSKKDDVWAVAKGSDNRLLIVRYASPLGGGAPAFRELRTSVSLGARATVSVWGTADGGTLWIASERLLLRVREDESGAVVDSLTVTTGAEDARPYLWRGIWGFGPDDIWVSGKQCINASCGSSQGEGAIGHYDGSSWTTTIIGSTTELLSLRGTAPGAERQLWYHCSEGSSGATVVHTYLVPVTPDGQAGHPLYAHAMDTDPACSSRVGWVTTPTSGWFSDGLLLCRWTGTAFEPASTGLSNRPVVQSVSGIWAGNADDVWMVGGAVTREGVPPSGFAAWRTAASAAAEKGGSP